MTWRGKMRSTRSNIRTTYTKSYDERYEVEVRHDGLHKYRLIKGDNKSVVEQKVVMQMQQWDESWQKKIDAEKKKQAKEQAIKNKEEKIELADKKTIEAKNELEGLEKTLFHTLSIDDSIDWDELKRKEDYPTQKPNKLKIPKKPGPTKIPNEPKISNEPKIPNGPKISNEPQKTDNKYQPKLGLLDRIISSRRIEKEEAADDLFSKEHKEWTKEKENAHKKWTKGKENAHKEWIKEKEIAHKEWIKEKEKAELVDSQIIEIYNLEVENLKKDHNKTLEKWEADRTKYNEERTKYNELIDEKKKQYLEKNTEAILDYCDLVLSNSQYPDYFPQSFELDYNPANCILIVDYQLPAIESLPTVKEVKYVASRNEFEEKLLSQAQINKMYDSILYQIPLRTIHELFEADKVDALSTVVFNGIVDSIDKSTGNQTTACVLSIQTGKEEFEAINLANIEPKICFKKLKGVGSSKLHSLTPIAPILKIDKDDKRFVDSYGVADEISEEDNLAAMDWQDFEHLIRELFEKEFASGGGEVKVTQASRDGGVDAIAFDPDPIRGGKIVIQAKRYTNTVGVSAVRDLYGTVMNEGAIKGILVSTADYGPDAYEFARGKPITLLNGANLLHMLAQHGHKAKIDLKEAKKIIEERERN